MAEIGYGYGREWHLMRFMARHRKCLERAICEKLDDEESKFVWLDFDFANKTDSSITGDVEIKGLSFLQSDEIKDHLSNELLDKIKKEYCDNNNIKLYYITYEEDIEERLEEILNDIQR